MKGSAGVLKPSVTVEQGMGVRVGLHRLVEGFVDKRVVIALTEHKGHDAAVIQIEDGAQVQLVYRNAFIPFEFRHIGQPLLVGLVRVELAVEKILRNVLRIFCPPGAAMVCCT